MSRVACRRRHGFVGAEARPDARRHGQDGPDDLLNLLIEVTGENKKDKAAKVAAARTLWVPAVNNHGGFGRWAFIEIADPWDTENMIRARFKGGKEP